MPAMMSPALKTLLIIAFLIAIIWNLGAGLYYMLTDKGESKRTVNALTKRIALSVALILLLRLANKLGCSVPHGGASKPGGPTRVPLTKEAAIRRPRRLQHRASRRAGQST